MQVRPYFFVPKNVPISLFAIFSFSIYAGQSVLPFFELQKKGVKLQKKGVFLQDFALFCYFVPFRTLFVPKNPSPLKLYFCYLFSCSYKKTSFFLYYSFVLLFIMYKETTRKGAPMGLFTGKQNNDNVENKGNNNDVDDKVDSTNTENPKNDAGENVEDSNVEDVKDKEIVTSTDSDNTNVEDNSKDKDVEDSDKDEDKDKSKNKDVKDKTKSLDEEIARLKAEIASFKSANEELSKKVERAKRAVIVYETASDKGVNPKLLEKMEGIDKETIEKNANDILAQIFDIKGKNGKTTFSSKNSKGQGIQSAISKLLK